MASRKRSYRYRVRCNECGKEMDTDWTDSHCRVVHGGKKVDYSRIIPSSQLTLPSLMFAPKSKKAATANENVDTNTPSTSMAEMSTENVVQETSESDNLSTTLPSSGYTGSGDEISVMSTISKEVKSQEEHVATETAEETFELQCTKDLSQPSIVVAEHSGNLEPDQPILNEYPRKRCGNEIFERSFNSDLYAKFPWLSYDATSDTCHCFPCKLFIGSVFKYSNWKKPEKLIKHERSELHQKQAMPTWLQAKLMHKKSSSVLKQLSNAHAEQVQLNRAYLKVIIECVVFSAQQNIALRGDTENRDLLWERSDTNRGNFLELMHLRCTDTPWLKERLQKQMQDHRAWLAPAIQNELLEIILDLIRELQSVSFRESIEIGLIMDETSDLSRDEQVSVCIRSVQKDSGDTTETFVGFFKTASTEGETLMELTTDTFKMLGISLTNVVGQCMDGAANMSGKVKGLSTRIREIAPRAIYVHCYGHVLNLALQDTMSALEPLRNALGVVQSLYNFLEASSKRHAFFEMLKVDEPGDLQELTLKSLSATRWSCRYVAVKAVINQIPKIMKALLILSEERDAKTSTDSKSLIRAISDFEFIFGLLVLRVILSNTDGLSRYIQSAKMDVMKAKTSADAVIATLQKCRTEDDFNNLWSTAEIYSEQVKTAISETKYDFKEPNVPRSRPSKRAQALHGEAGDETGIPRTAKDYYRRSCYFVCIDRVITEMKERFQGNDQDVLCALGDVVYNKKPEDKAFEIVSKFYDLDRDLLESQKYIFETSYSDDARSSCSVVQWMHQNDAHLLLPVFYKTVKILATVPATSCSAERSFSALRRIKTFLRTTMGQQRMNSIAVVNIERKYSNMVVNEQMDKIIDTFGRRKGRNSFFN